MRVDDTLIARVEPGEKLAVPMRPCLLALTIFTWLFAGMLACFPDVDVMLGEDLRTAPREHTSPGLRGALENDLASYPDLIAIVDSAKRASSLEEQCSVICRGLRALMPGRPIYPEGRWDPLPSVVLDAPETLRAWQQCRTVDSLSIACLSQQLALASGI